MAQAKNDPIPSAHFEASEISPSRKTPLSGLTMVFVIALIVVTYNLQMIISH